MRIMTFLANLVILNILFLISCIPIVTAGPAITAMNYVVFNMSPGQDVHIAQSFFRSFRQNFRQGLIIWLLMLLVGYLLGMDIYVVWFVIPNTIQRIAVTIVSVIYLMTLIYVFPLLSRFNNSVFRTIRNAVVLSFNAFPKTLSMLVLIVASVLGTLYSTTTLVYGMFVWLLLGFSGIAYLNSLLLRKTFQKYSQIGTEPVNPDESKTETESEE